MLAANDLEPQQLQNLTERQCEVMDLLVQHLTSKEIAREIGIHPTTVDHHIAAVRQKFDVPDRNSAARRYRQLCEHAGKPTSALSPVDPEWPPTPQPRRELPISPLFTISDSASFGSWEPAKAQRPLLEALDQRFGIFGRVLAIIGLALALNVTIVLSLTIAESLGKIF